MAQTVTIPPTASAPPVRPAPPAPCGAMRRTNVCVSSEQLFAGANEVHIEHRGALYRLQQTSLGKLILTK
jgi:hemin uptake protein HemP